MSQESFGFLAPPENMFYGARRRNTVTIGKNGLTRINAGCLDMHSIRNYESVVLLYAPKTNTLALKLLKNSDSGYAVAKRKLQEKGGAMLVSFTASFRAYGLDPKVWAGTYEVEQREDVVEGEVLILASKKETASRTLRAPKGNRS